MHGIRWTDIDENLILKKLISKSIRGKRAVELGDGDVAEFDLRSYPMVMEELDRYQRDRSGPLIKADV